MKQCNYHCLLLLLLLLLLLKLSKLPTTHQASSHEVIIIGAGMSGIMAARTLSKHGIKDFLILEATDRIGGRMHQTTFAGHVIEIGANWVEGVGGEKENPIWSLAKMFNIVGSFSNFDNFSANTYNEEGELLPTSITTPHYDLTLASYNYSNSLSVSLSENKEEDISISTAQRLFGFIPTSPLDMVYDWAFYDFEIAEPPRVTSLKNVQPNPTFDYYGEDEYFVHDKRGYVYILEQLAKGFLKHDKNGHIIDRRLQLNKVVRKVEYSSNGVTITTEGGDTYNAKYAIISVSLGVLKSQLIQYTPDLPYWKIKTFYQFDMSIYTKIFLKFPYTFWPTGPGTEFFLYADSKRGYYPFWQHLEGEFPGAHILFVTVTDDESRRIEQQSDNVTKDEIMVVLRKMFGNNIPEAEDILVPRWWKNRFFGGSYTNWPIGVTKDDFDRMKAPVGPLYFTGEHTSAQFNGYVHGAYLEGIACANALLDCIKHGKCNEITSDGVPWEQIEPSNVDKNLTKTCNGTCCAEIQQERETLRQYYVNAINSLQHSASTKCGKP